jgi:hypothetical protein
LATALRGATGALALVELRIDDPAVAEAAELVELARRVFEFDRAVRARAGLAPPPPAPGARGTARARRVPTILEFVDRHGPELPPDVRSRPVLLLSAYLDHVARAASGAAPARSEPGPDPTTRRDLLERVYTYVDAVHDARSRLAAGPGGEFGHPAAPAIRNALDRVFDAFRDLLRGYGIAVVAPEEGQLPDPASSRVAQSVPRRGAAPQTVVRVVRCGFKNAVSGEILRMAEVITAT